MSTTMSLRVRAAFGIAVICLLSAVGLASAQEAERFSDREFASYLQLVRCPDVSTVYFIGSDAKRYVYPNNQTFLTYYPDFSHVRFISCEDLAEFPLGGVVPYRQGTRYLKFQYDPKVYAVEPGGVLRAVPDEQWMETFVGDDWASMIDDLSDAFVSSYTFGEDLALMEIPNGMTAKDPETDIWYYFVDGQPKSLEGISFHFLDNGDFRNFTRTKEMAPQFYVRVEPALEAGTRIGTEDEFFLLGPMGWDEPVEVEDFPQVRLYEEGEV